MMRDSKAYQIWLIFFPILIYFAVMEFVSILVVRIAQATGLVVSGTMRQLLGMLAGGLILYVCFYRKERADYLSWHDSEIPGRFGGAPSLRGAVGTCLLMLAAGYAANNFAAVINLSSFSASYGETESYLYSGGFGLELVAFVLVAPAAEELLYRGIVFCRLRRLLGRWQAILLSTVLFSIFHFNLVQMAYALYMGLLLALLMEYGQKPMLPVLGHAAANLLSVLRSEWELLSIETLGYDLYLGSALVLFVLTLVTAGVLAWRLQKRLHIIEK